MGACALLPRQEETCRVALCVVSIAASKDPAWNPFRKSQSLSEIHIERHFGRLRSQFANAEMTVRQYWHACARLSRQIARSQKRDIQLPDPCEEKPLSTEELFNDKQANISLLSIIFLSHPIPSYPILSHPSPPYPKMMLSEFHI